MSLSPAAAARAEVDATAAPERAIARPEDARRFVRLFVLLVALPLLAQIAFNWLVNPWGLYAPRLLAARVVDERYKKCALLRQVSPPPQQLVLGTSRVMRFEPSLLEARTGLRTFNAAIPGVIPADLLVLYRYAAEEARAPLRRVILGIDSLIFFGGQGNYRAIQNNTQLRRFLPEGDPLVGDVGGLTLLLSPAQTADGLASIRHALGWTKTQGERWRVFDPDGLQSRNYQDEAREQGRWNFAQIVERQVKGRYLNPKTPNPTAFRDLDTLLALLEERHIEAVVLITPVLPEVHAHWQETGFGERDREIRARVATIAGRHGARFADFSDVASFGGDPSEFYDTIHPTIVNTRRLITALFPEPVS